MDVVEAQLLRLLAQWEELGTLADDPGPGRLLRHRKTGLYALYHQGELRGLDDEAGRRLEAELAEKQAALKRFKSQGTE